MGLINLIKQFLHIEEEIKKKDKKSITTMYYKKKNDDVRVVWTKEQGVIDRELFDEAVVAALAGQSYLWTPDPGQFEAKEAKEETNDVDNT